MNELVRNPREYIRIYEITDINKLEELIKNIEKAYENDDYNTYSVACNELGKCIKREMKEEAIRLNEDLKYYMRGDD